MQRINLTTALGTSLVNTMFVLDEPSIGLHPRDMNRIVEAMQRLRDAGNTLVVVEHDPAVMLAADRLIDMGPGPGERQGRIVFDGTPAAARQADTLTGAYLGGAQASGAWAAPRLVVNEARRCFVLGRARAQPAQHDGRSFPLQRLVWCDRRVGLGQEHAGAGRAGAGAGSATSARPTEAAGAHDRLLGADWLAARSVVDQSPIGRPRAATRPATSAPSTNPQDLRRRPWRASALHRRHLQLQRRRRALPHLRRLGLRARGDAVPLDVYLRCPDCDGRRFRAEILDVRLVRGPCAARVADVLDLTVAEAAHWFQRTTAVVARLQPIVDVGLDYVRLGQPVPTLSGGEAQRLKLAGFLAEAAANPKWKPAAKRAGTLFLFDEPTTGLHFDDIAKLMRACASCSTPGIRCS